MSVCDQCPSDSALHPGAAGLEIAETIADQDPAPRKLNRRAVTAALMMVMVLASMEQTVTSTAMPSIIGSLHGLQHYSWVASIYLLACTVSMPLYGRLADTLGRKRVILFAIGLFIVASVLASTAQDMLQLILYRGLQGLGAGGIMPVVLTILGDIFTLKERAKIQGLFSAVWGTASLAGPALGWFLVVTLGWRSVFFINLPFALIAFFVLVRSYHDQEKARSVDLDLIGAIAMAVGCMSLLTLASRLGPGGWALPVALGLAAIFIVSLAFSFYHERHTENPIMPLELLLKPAIGPTLLGSCLLGIGFLSLDTFVPLYVQGGRGGGPGAAAWAVTPVMLTWALSGIIAAPMVVRFGFRRIAWIGSALVVFGFTGLLLCATFGWPKLALGAVLAVTGLGFGPASMSYLLAAQGAVEWQQRGVITGAIQFFRTIGGAIGIGVLGALFNSITQPKLQALQKAGISPAALLDPHARALLDPKVLADAGQMIGGGLLWVFVAMLAVSILQVVITGWMPRQAAPKTLTPLEAAEAAIG